MKLVDCKAIREEILDDVKSQIEKLDYTPQLHIISIGEDKASQTYINNKIKTAEQVGIESFHYTLGGDISQEEAELQIMEIAQKKQGAVMLQLPIPSHLDEDRLIGFIPGYKDVDGLTSYNMGKLVQGHEEAIIPATVNAVYHIVKKYFGEDLSGLNATVVNRSKLIGQPLQALLTHHNATVTLCHSKTRELQSPMIKSDILVTGIGKSKYFNSKNCSDEYQLIIDCGINYVDGKLVGDWDEDDLVGKCDDTVILTPVGKSRSGVGSITVACLMLNVIKCCELQRGE